MCTPLKRRYPSFLTNFFKDAILVGSIVASHINKCKKLSYLKNALPVVIPEANLPTIAQNILYAMRDLQVNCVFMNEDDNKGSEQRNDLPGSITTRRNKVEMVLLLVEEYMKKRRLVFNREFIVAEPEYSVVEDVKGEYVKQLRNFCQKRKQKVDRDGTIFFETFYTGTTTSYFTQLIMN